MKQFIALIRKEFYHVIRDKRTLLILVGMPIVQILIFGFALTNEIKQSKIAAVDPSKDQMSQGLLKKIAANPYFDLVYSDLPNDQLEAAFRKGDIKLAIIFPTEFEKKLNTEKAVTLQVIADGSDPNTATTLTTYLNAIIRDFSKTNLPGSGNRSLSPSQPQLQIQVAQKMLYNPQLDSAPQFVPGVMALVLMLICVLMTAVSIVKEKETGTMESLLVAPFKPIGIITAKAVPYFLLSLLNVVTILLLSVFVIHLPVAGSLVLLLAESMLFILTCLLLGILISIKTKSQQAAMLISLMGMLLPTILFSGFMFPIENMPIALQWISNLIPARWFYIIVKNIMIKGLGFAAIWKETCILFGITFVLLLISLKSFKVRLE